MTHARRILLLGAPHRDPQRPHHGCVAALWVWCVCGAVVIVVGLAVGACCAAF